jgi:hypothetical protein
MVVRLTLAFLIMAAGAMPVSAQGNTAANAAAKQDKQPVASTQQSAAPKSATTRNEKKPATANVKPTDAVAPVPPRSASAGAHDTKKDVPRIQPSELGRMPVDNKGATFGFSSETKMNMYATPDGQRIRGLDHGITTNRQPNYFGLSLSVPTTGTSSGDGPPGLFPLPPRN